MALKRKIKNIDFRFIIAFIAAWTLLFTSILKGSLSTDSAIYAIGEKSAYSAGLFQGNMYMGEGVISPRYILDMIFGFLMRLNGGDWAGAALVWLYFGTAIQALGIANIAHRINDRYQITISAVLVFVIAYSNNNLAGFGLNILNTIGIGQGIAFAFLSISFLAGESRDYNKAWVFAVCAAICHIHEGLYCCAVIFLFALVDSLVQKKLLLKENRMALVAAAALFAITLPNILTDSMSISDAEFVYIYSFFKSPHHLVPSTWGIFSICETIGINICLFALSVATAVKLKSKEAKFYLYESMALVAAWAAALLLMYVFTELKPVALVSTVFLSKFFKYVFLIAVIWVVTSVFKLRDEGEYITGCLPLFFTLFARRICNMAAIIVSICVRKLGINIGFSSDLHLSFKAAVADELKSIWEQGMVVSLVFVAAIAVIEFVIKRKFRGYLVLWIVAFLCMIGRVLSGRVILYQNGMISLINGETALRTSMGDDLYELAEDFRGETNVTTEFLADPDSAISTSWFQVVSERNCYVVRQVVPSSKSTVKEWYERYLETTSFDEKTNDEIERIMSSAGIEYVLMDADNYSKLDEAEEFSVFMSSPEDSYRIYKLNRGDGSL